MKEEKTKDIIRLMAELLSGVQVPRSLGVHMLGVGTEAYDTIRWELGLHGWLDPEDIEKILREKIEFKNSEKTV